MKLSKYHFYQRTDRHKEHLEGREDEIEKIIRKSIRGIGKQVKVQVHSSHIHVFAEVKEKEKFKFTSSIKQEILKMDNIRWDANHYLMPVSSLDRRYINRLLEEMHKPVLI